MKKRMILDEPFAISEITGVCQQELTARFPKDLRRNKRLDTELNAIRNRRGLGLGLYTMVLVTSLLRSRGTVFNLRGAAGSFLTAWLSGISHCDPVMDGYEIPFEGFPESGSRICFNINVDRSEFVLLHKTLSEILPKEYQEDSPLVTDPYFIPDDRDITVDYVFCLHLTDGSSGKLSVSVQKTKEGTKYIISDHGSVAEEEAPLFTIRFLHNRGIDLLNDLGRSCKSRLHPEWPEIEEKMMELFREKRTVGLPEFGSGFVRTYMLDTITPADFHEAVRLSGMSHSTNGWIGNAEELIRQQGYAFEDVIAVREDVYNILVKYGADRDTAIALMMQVGKGRHLSEEDSFHLRELGVPEYVIESCSKIRYLFPYAHIAEYCYIAFCLGWYKAHDMRAYYELWSPVQEQHIKEAEEKYPAFGIAQNLQAELTDFWKEMTE